MAQFEGFYTIAVAVLLCWAGGVQADVGQVPTAATIAGTTFCSVPGWRYADRWDLLGGGAAAATAAECAQACKASALCTGANYNSSSNEVGNNCWFKDWGISAVPPPCLPDISLFPNADIEVEAIFESPADEECESFEYTNATVFSCEDESLISGRWTDESSNNSNSNSNSTAEADSSASASGTYERFPGRDYVPGTPKSVAVQDIDFGILVETIENCEAACDANSICNVAAFLESSIHPGGPNCHLKRMTETCSLPDDAEYLPEVILSLKCDDENTSGGNTRENNGTTGTRTSSASDPPQIESDISDISEAPTASDRGESGRPGGVLADNERAFGTTLATQAGDTSSDSGRNGLFSSTVRWYPLSHTTWSHRSHTGVAAAAIVGGSVAAAALVFIVIVLVAARRFGDRMGGAPTQADTRATSLPHKIDFDMSNAQDFGSTHRIPVGVTRLTTPKTTSETQKSFSSTSAPPTISIPITTTFRSLTNDQNILEALIPDSISEVVPKLMISDSSDAGAVGQAAADASAPCMFQKVATRDSMSNCACEGGPLVAPAAGAPRQEWKEHLERQLDSLLGKVVHGSLKVLRGSHNRHHGGQAVVQIADDCDTREEYAMKFFLSPGGFKHERALYEDKTQPLGRFLPQLHAIAEGEGSGLRDAHGTLMPPCIIMEKGDALDVWIESSGGHIDLFTGLQVLSHIAERLKALHEAGYVHRDIKPGNIMWLPRTKRWTLIDFGCAAPIHTHAPTGFSLYYAAPEALAACILRKSTKAEEALDAWSLGVLAIELLSGKQALDTGIPRRQTVEMILGVRQAPWELPEAQKKLLRPLGIFKGAVLALLTRNPAERSTIHQFQLACRRVLASTTVTTTHGTKSDISSAGESTLPSDVTLTT